MGQIYSFSGSHSTGKSTSVSRKYEELKMLHPRKSIYWLCDQEALSPYPINKNTTPESQEWIFANQIMHELLFLQRFDILITDRTIVDVIAYTRYAGFDDLATGMFAVAKSHMSIYKEITFKQIKFNDFLYDDGVRDANDKQFRQDVENIMISIYKDLTILGHIPGNIYYA